MKYIDITSVFINNDERDNKLQKKVYSFIYHLTFYSFINPSNLGAWI